MTAYRLAWQSKHYKSSDIEVPEVWCSLRIRKQDSRTVRLKEKSEDEAQHGPKRDPGVGFNLLWLEFQNTRWLMHIAFGFVPSFLCSRTSSSSTFLPFSFPVWSLALSSYTTKRFNPTISILVANVNSFCHTLSGRMLLTLDLFVPSWHSRVPSNDIYAILIGYLLYMRLHTSVILDRTLFVTVA